MKSIRRYLLQSLIAALCLGTLLIALFLYIKSAEEINELYDSNMKELAEILSVQYKPSQFVATVASDLSTQTHQDMIVEEEEFLIQVWNKAGEVVYTTHPLITLPQQASKRFGTINYQHEKWRVFTLETNQGVIQVSQPQAARHIYIWHLATGLLLPLLLQIPLIGIFIWIAVGKSLKPFERISKAIQSRSASSLEHVSQEDLPEEIQPVMNELNSLLTRLERAISLQRNFTADAAHELRTPLAALQLQFDILARSKSEEERIEAVNTLQKGITRASNLVSQLLTLARLGSELAKQHTMVELNQTIKPILEDHLDQAATKNIDVGFDEKEPLLIKGNADTLSVVARNLIDNAIRYSPSDSKVDILIYSTETEVVFEVRDSAVLISDTEKQRIFERFYRGSTSHGVSGSGLGLAIVMDIIQQHQARLEVKARTDASGNVFAVYFPSSSRRYQHE